MVGFDVKEIHMKEDKLLEEGIIRGQKAAAAFAKVSVRTIRNWKAEGMPVTKEGDYIETELNAFKETKKAERVFVTRDKIKTLISEINSATANLVSIRGTLLQLLS